MKYKKPYWQIENARFGCTINLKSYTLSDIIRFNKMHFVVNKLGVKTYNNHIVEDNGMV